MRQSKTQSSTKKSQFRPVKKNDSSQISSSKKEKELPESAFGNFKAPFDPNKTDRPLQRWETEGGATASGGDRKATKRLTPRSREH
ncbi:MAG: hypothetical protein AB7H97_19710 [Pseudobdellovibrionaceae bacterium]